VGTWGPAIFSDDLAADIRGEFKDHIGDGMSAEEATAVLLDEYRESIADPDSSLLRRRANSSPLNYPDSGDEKPRPWDFGARFPGSPFERAILRLQLKRRWRNPEGLGTIFRRVARRRGLGRGGVNGSRRLGFALGWTWGFRLGWLGWRLSRLRRRGVGLLRSVLVGG
jgi:hypothetical protein